MYKTWWLPIELKAGSIAKISSGKNDGDILESLLEAFLSEEFGDGDETCGSKKSEFHSNISKMVGGDLYANFRDYVTHTKEAGVGGEEVLRKVHDFALGRYFVGGYVKRRKVEGGGRRAEGFGGRGGVGIGGAKKCPRCAFPNDATADVCTACNLQPI